MKVELSFADSVEAANGRAENQFGDEAMLTNSPGTTPKKPPLKQLAETHKLGSILNDRGQRVPADHDAATAQRISELLTGKIIGAATAA